MHCDRQSSPHDAISGKLPNNSAVHIKNFVLEQCWVFNKTLFSLFVRQNLKESRTVLVKGYLISVYSCAVLS